MIHEITKIEFMHLDSSESYRTSIIDGMSTLFGANIKKKLTQINKKYIKLTLD